MNAKRYGFSFEAMQEKNFKKLRIFSTMKNTVVYKSIFTVLLPKFYCFRREGQIDIAGRQIKRYRSVLWYEGPKG
jgi:hypothetical protein